MLFMVRGRYSTKVVAHHVNRENVSIMNMLHENFVKTLGKLRGIRQFFL